jgi:hypothetical protein
MEDSLNYSWNIITYKTVTDMVTSNLWNNYHVVEFPGGIIIM